MTPSFSRAAHNIDRARSLARRAAFRAWRQINPSSTAGLPWKRQGEHITFTWTGFVSAPSIPMLFARHHYETALINRLLRGHSISRSLEVGCGFGRLSPTFAARSDTHVPIDINPEALAEAQVAYPHLRFQLVDGNDLPFPDDSFDLVTTWSVLQHIPPHKIGHALAEIRRVLAPGGIILMCEETRNPGQPFRHVWHRDPGFYEQALGPLNMTCSSYIQEIDRLPGLISPGRVMLLSAHLVTSPAAAAIRRLLGGRTAQYFHANEILGKPRLSVFAAARADVVIAVSAYTASLIAATGASPANLRVIPPGVDLPSDPGALPTERPTVLTIAQLNHSYKGHDVLIRALAGVRAQVPNVEWVVIGEGPLRPGLEELASSCGLAGAARFLGAVSDEERNRWLRRADVFAMPSRLPGEGFGIVYLEANAYGKPVVARNVAGPLDAVADGVSGMLVDPTDPAAVGEAVTRLLLDRDLAQRLGRGGAARARDFAWPVIAGKVEAALLELAETGS
jgi:SAM-dependent methyltransferase